MPAKYKIIAEDLRSQILLAKSLKPYKLPTEQELCSKYLVSRQTVRQALDTLEKEKLITRRQGSGAYTIPQTEVLKEKKIILMISEESEYTYPAFISDIRSVLRTRGLTLTVCITGNDINTERTLLTSFLEQTVQVLLIEGIQSAFSNPNIDLYERLQLSGTQIIFINHYYPEIHNAAFICSDDTSGNISYRAASRLLMRYFRIFPIMQRNGILAYRQPTATTIFQYRHKTFSGIHRKISACCAAVGIPVSLPILSAAFRMNATVFSVIVTKLLTG